MRKIIVLEFITMDGVMQAPGGRRKMLQEFSNTAVGLRRTMTISSARKWKNKWLENTTYFWGEKHMIFSQTIGQSTRNSGLK